LDFNSRIIGYNKIILKGNKMVKEELNFAKNDDFNLTMIPGKFAKAMRTCKIWQLFRFMVINVKMLVVVAKSH
jgi:hypothetical protein